MKKRLTESQFQAAIKSLKMGQETLDIAHGVLVNGESQAAFAKSFSITKGAVWQTVQRVWNVHKNRSKTTDGLKQITVVLPEHQAFIVEKWSENTKKKAKNHENSSNSQPKRRGR